MSKVTSVVFSGLLVAICAVATPIISKAADAQSFLNATSWDVKYDFDFKASSQGSFGNDFGHYDYTTLLDHTFSAAIALDLRSGGPSISMLRTAAFKDPTSLSVADQQKATMDMLARMDNTANWMNSGVHTPDDATEKEQTAAAMAFIEASKGKASVDYLQVVKGDNLTDETGTKFSSLERTTRKGSARVRTANQLMFELDASAKTYILMVGFGFIDDSSSSVKIEQQVHTVSAGAAPHDTTTTSWGSLSQFPQKVLVDDSTVTSGETLLLNGSFDPAAGKITGEHSLKAHYSGFQGDIPGTLIVRYTLTPRQ